MAHFDYKGLNQQGQSVKGTIEAESLKLAKNKLKKKQIFPQEILAAGSGKTFQTPLITTRVKTKSLAVFTQMLASLIKAGVPLVEALDAIQKQTPEHDLASSIQDIKNQVNEGKSLHQALQSYPRIFDYSFVSLCEAGETSGNLDKILMRLADLMEKRALLKSRIRMALIYPGVLFFFTASIVLALFTYVIPKVTELFENSENIPWITSVVISLSNFLLNYWFSLLILICIASILFMKWKRSTLGKKIWHRFVLRVPIIGQLLRSSDISLFARTFSTLLYGGVPVLEALDIVKKSVSNVLIKQAIQQARNNIKEGESIAFPLSRSEQFPPVVIQMIRVGEQSGDLEGMLEQVSNSYDRKIDTEVSALTSVLEPIMIIFMGLIIAFVVFSVMLPMLGSFDDLGG